MDRTVRVDLGERSYDVRIASGLTSGVGRALQAELGAARAVVISDTTVAPLRGELLLASLRGAGITADLITFPAGEEYKTLATCGLLFDALFALAPAIDRQTMIVALGGGITGDVAGFVAASALRGLRWVQCPTTLLANVDASVGGKTGVDHPAGKNLIGAFHQPRGVFIDVDALHTLDVAHVRGGLAECVKHAIIRDVKLLEWIEDHVDDLLACDDERMIELIARNVEIKATVVANDEREAGQRAHLNFGHTIGHAIEALGGYQTVSHGQAVSLGMVAALHMAVRRGFIEQDAAHRVEALLERIGLPIRHAGLDPATVWDVMQHDKKALGGQVRMVLTAVLGQVAVFDDITEEMVADAVTYLGG